MTAMPVAAAITMLGILMTDALCAPPCGDVEARFPLPLQLFEDPGENVEYLGREEDVVLQIGNHVD
jgi:hypothetical protein